MIAQTVGMARRRSFVATTAIVCFAYFALALLLMHALRPERELATTWISG